MHGVWHSSNTFPAMAQGQAFCIISWQPPSRGFPLSTTIGCTQQLCGFEYWEPSPISNNFTQ